jgi:hypothetical protein
MRPRNLESRIEKLEHLAVSVSDQEILAWGEGVKDAELEAVAEQWPHGMGDARNLSDADLYRIVKPAIDEQRKG